MSIKSRKKCAHCGESRPYMLDFHHPDRDDKISCISRLWTHGSRSLDTEISKCVVLCANCHRLLHYLNIPTEEFLSGGDQKREDDNH